MWCELIVGLALVQTQATPPPKPQPPVTTPASAQTAAPAKPQAKDDVIVPAYSDTVVVTASRVKQALIDAPASMTVVGPEQIASSPATQIGELLQGVPGLNVIQFGTRDFQVAGRQSASAGGTGQLVLVDGRVANNGNSGMFWDQLAVDPEEIEQIEVLHGSASMVWGANAMGAVINLRTKSPRQMLGLHVTAGVGERGLGTGSVRWADARGKMSYKVSASYLRTDGWDRPTTFVDGSPITGNFAYTNPPLYQPKVDGRLDYETSPDHVWSFRGGYGATSGMMFGSDLPIDVKRSFSSAYADVSYNAPSVDARVSWGHAGGPFRSLIDNSINQASSTFPSAEVNVHHVLNSRNLLVFGGAVRLDRWDLAVVPKRSSRNTGGAYIEDEIFLGQAVRVDVGGRLDYVQFAGPIFSPRVTVLLKPATRQSFRFSVSRGYRIPSPIEGFVDYVGAYGLTLAPGFAIPVPIHVTGNEDLRRVRSAGLELGYTGVMADRHTLQATVYRLTASDNIQSGVTEFYSPEQPPATWPFPAAIVPRFALPKTVSYVNTGEVRNQGVELALNSNWFAGFWSVLSYTYQQKPTVSKADPAFPIDVNFPSPNQFSATAGWNRAPWRGSVSVVYADRAFWTDVLATDPRIRGYSTSHTLTNASLSYAVPGRNVELIVKGTNLFDQAIQQHTFGDVVRRQVSVLARFDFKK